MRSTRMKGRVVRPFVMAGVAAGLMVTAGPRARAERLPDVVVPVRYIVQWAPDLTRETFTGRVSIDVEVRAPTATLVLHAVDLTIDGVTVTQETEQPASATLDKESQQLRLSLGQPLRPGKGRIAISFAGELNKQLAGLYVGKTEKRNYAATQFEPTDARRAFPCFDEPALKATYEISAVVDEGDMAISNSPQIADVPGPEPGKHTVTFAPTPRMSVYLVALLVGNFKCIGEEVDGTPIRVCALAGQEPKGRYALKIAGDILRYYNRYYGIKYPFAKLDHIAIPDFAAGAMENTGAIVYREIALLIDETTAPPDQKRWVASIVAHEIAHQWFGNLVTMRWWDDIWLNEGFASWMETKPLAELEPEWQVDLVEGQSRNFALAADSVAATRAIRTAAESAGEINALFDAVAYPKAAAVLRMLEQYVGREPFRKGVNAYLTKHAYDNANSEDFGRAIAAVSGKPADTVLSAFVSQPGAPLVSIAAECVSGRTTLELTQRRFFDDPERAAKPSAERWQFPVCVRGPAGEPSCHMLSGQSQRVTLPGCGDWVFANANGDGYYRTLYAPAVRNVLTRGALTQLTPKERLTFYADEWAFVGPNLQNAADYLTLVDSARSERNREAWNTLTGPLPHLHDEVVGPGDLPRFEGWIRSITAPVVAELGVTARPDDSDDRRLFRARAMWLLGVIGGDQATRQILRAALERYFTNPTDVDPSLVDAGIDVALREADEATFDRFLQVARTTADALDRDRFLYRLAGFRSERLMRRAMDLLLTADVRSQDALIMLDWAFGHPVGRQVAWPFLKSHFAELMAKIGPGPGAGIVGIVGGICNADLLADARKFFRDQNLPGSERPLQESVERAESCIRLKAVQQRPIHEWITAAVPSARTGR